ncbi:MAG TPA: hypothetical protein VHL10_05205 [Nitrososphaera sp.]|jgi:hypothetical protein|nr:hypothetical protein [Nitrososphaera sp.]
MNTAQLTGILPIRTTRQLENLLELSPILNIHSGEEKRSYLEELANIPAKRIDPDIIRYSCYLLPYYLHSFGMHVHALHGAIMRHHYLFKTLPRAAYVSQIFRTALMDEIGKVTGERPEDGTYVYRFVLGKIDHKVYIHRDKSMPDFLAEIREIGLPSTAVICVH